MSEPSRPRDPDTIGHRIAHARAVRSLDQKELGALVGEALGLDRAVSKHTISTWETGRYHPPLDRLVALCRVLCVSADVLLGLAPFAIPAIPERAPRRPRDPDTIGHRIAHARAVRSLDQTQLGVLVGEALGIERAVSQHTISTWETGRNHPPLDRLVALCRVLHMSADVLLGLAPFAIPAIPEPEPEPEPEPAKPRKRKR